jgi:hypothetical protein
MAGKYAVAHPGSKILADEVVSNFLTWRYPQLQGRVGFDARFEQYPLAEQLAFANWILAGPGWLKTARNYQIMVASERNPRLVAALRHLSSWRVVYDGPQGIVVTR